MASIDNIAVKSTVAKDGNTYTAAVSNDTLTNDDFLKLLLEEMKMQDPTKPMDSQKMMDTQLQMSTIQANTDMTNAMTKLQAAYSDSALSTAAGLIGNIIEDGSISDTGLQKSYKVETVENIAGDMSVNARELTGVDENGNLVLSDTVTTIPMSIITKIR